LRVVDLISKKKRGEALTGAEVRFLVEGFASGVIPDYQMAAWLMAVCFQGLGDEETKQLTASMVASGSTLDLFRIAPRAVDKHSTGGVGDKTTLVVAPLVASLGVPVAKMSGRGLGHTGGTADKLESIPGLVVTMSREAFVRQLEEIGVVLASTSADLAPADGKLYALRDATATVESIPLIASSVMSKKLAVGAQGIVLDVKVGKGAFMKNLVEAESLATTMIDIGESFGRRVSALLTSMDQPLGQAIGNALEVREAIDTLRGQGPDDLVAICTEIDVQMLLLGGRYSRPDEARTAVAEAIATGAAWRKFAQLVQHQGGKVEAVERPNLLSCAPCVSIVPSPHSGYLSAVNAQEIGIAASLLGAGRQQKGDPVDPAAGIVLRAKAGDWVQRGDPLLELHGGSVELIQKARTIAEKAFAWSGEKPIVSPLVLKVLGASCQ
jgi:pyrimidine-nucleoside phosphorylase